MSKRMVLTAFPTQKTQQENGPLMNIAYVSDSIIPTQDEAYLAQVTDILETSAYSNNKCNITGTMLFSVDRFVQVIEGPITAVRYLIGKIVSDQRHRNLMILESNILPERNFEDWTMRYIENGTELDLLRVNSCSYRDSSKSTNMLIMLRHILSGDKSAIPWVSRLSILYDAFPIAK